MRYDLTIIPIEECNCRCSFCFHEQFRGTSVSPSDVQTFLHRFDTYKQPDDTATICIFGGEPTLDLPLLQQIYTICDQYDWIEDIVLMTNLQCSARDLLAHTKTKHFHRLQLGLSDIGGERGHAEKAFVLQPAVDRLSIVTVITGENEKEVLEIYRWMLDHNLIDSWSPAIDRTIPDYRIKKDGIVQTLRSLFHEILRTPDVPELDLFSSFFEEASCERCQNGIRMFSLDTQGNVCGCPHIPFKRKDLNHPEKVKTWLHQPDISVPLQEWTLQPLAFLGVDNPTYSFQCPIDACHQTGLEELLADIKTMMKEELDQLEQEGYRNG